MGSEVIFWVVLSLLFGWQCLLTWVMARGRDDSSEERHRMARVGCLVSDLVDRFEQVASRSLEQLEDAPRTRQPRDWEATREPPRPPARAAGHDAGVEECPRCRGQGVVPRRPPRDEAPPRTPRRRVAAWESPDPAWPEEAPRRLRQAR